MKDSFSIEFRNGEKSLKITAPTHEAAMRLYCAVNPTFISFGENGAQRWGTLITGDHETTVLVK